MMTAVTNDAAFWNRAARKYATSPIKDMAGYERTLSETTRWLRSGDQVLEIGCGTGMTALRLASAIAHVTATDVSSGMIAIARDRASRQGAGNAHFAVAAADAIPAADASLDAVLAFNLLHLVPDRASVLAEVRRVLKPGGLFISKTPCLSEMNPAIRLAVPVMRLFGKAPHVGFFDALRLEREFAEAGLQTIERARHGSGRKDPRIFIVARKAD